MTVLNIRASLSSVLLTWLQVLTEPAEQGACLRLLADVVTTVIGWCTGENVLRMDGHSVYQLLV